MKDQTNVHRAPERDRHEQENQPEPGRISFYATDGAIPLNFMPVPQEYDPDRRSTESDIAIDRTLARITSWVRRPQSIVARWATPIVKRSRNSEKHTAANEI